MARQPRTEETNVSSAPEVAETPAAEVETKVEEQKTEETKTEEPVAEQPAAAPPVTAEQFIQIMQAMLANRTTLVPVPMPATTRMMAPIQPLSPAYRAELVKLPTKSAMIRKMAADGYTKSAISKHLNIIYQHVRNVLNTPVKRPMGMETQVIEGNVFRLNPELVKAESEKVGLTEAQITELYNRLSGITPTVAPTVAPASSEMAPQSGGGEEAVNESEEPSSSQAA